MGLHLSPKSKTFFLSDKCTCKVSPSLTVGKQDSFSSIYLKRF